MRYGFALAALAGVVVAVLLAAHLDSAAVLRSLRAVGWWVVAIAAFHLVPLLLSAAAWQFALAPAHRRSLGVLLVLRWIREAVSGLLPVAQLGGDVVGARLLAGPAVPATAAAASVVVDLTVELVTLGLFILLGLVLLTATSRWAAASGWMQAGSAALLAGVLVCAAASRPGLLRPIRGLFERVVRLPSFFDSAFVHDIGRAARARYADRRAMAAAGVLHLLSWLAAAGEIWLVLRCMGVPIGVREALVIESLSHALRSAAFFVPGALGVQEAGFIEIGALFGIAPEAALALALARRMREIALGAPALLAWQAL